MVPELKYYNVVEPYHDEDGVGEYLHKHGIGYHLAGRTLYEADKIDFNWMATMKPTTVMVYTVKLSPEDTLVLKLTFPNIHITEVRPETKMLIADLVKKVVQV